MSGYKHQKHCDPCLPKHLSSISCKGVSGKHIWHSPSYGRSDYPQTYWGGYGRCDYPQTSWGGYGRCDYPQTYWGAYGRGYYPPIYSGGYGYGGCGYGRRWGWGSRRGSICNDPCSYRSGGYCPPPRRYSCSNIDGWGYGSRRGSICDDPCISSSGVCHPLTRRPSLSIKKKTIYAPQQCWDPCRRGSYSYGGLYGDYGKRISYYPSYGCSYYPQTYWGAYGRSCYPPIYYGGYGYGCGLIPPQYYGGYGLGQRLGWGWGSRRGSICDDPCSYRSGVYYPLTRRYSCSNIDGWGYGTRRGSICDDPCKYKPGLFYPPTRRYSCSNIYGSL